MKALLFVNASIALLLALLLCRPVAAAPSGGFAKEQPVAADTLPTVRPVLLFFTASWCAPCKYVRSDTFRDPKVAALLARCEVRLLDIDTPEGSALHEKYGTHRGGVPELVLFDKKGGKVGSMIGYHRDARLTADLLKGAFSPEELATLSAAEASPLSPAELSLSSPRDEAGAQPEKMPFGLRLFYSRWCLCFGGGVTFAQIASSEYDTFRTGFYLSAGAACRFGRKWQAESGLSFDASGGRSDAGEVIRSYYLTLPAEVQYRLFSFSGLGMRVSVAGGLYGACLVGESSPEGVSLDRWDAGARARLLLEAGSFCLSAGYSRGFVRCLNDKGYNQRFTLGLSLNLGK